VKATDFDYQKKTSCEVKGAVSIVE
jgi:hypothetical protein